MKIIKIFFFDKNALPTEDLFKDERFICLINNISLDENKSFAEVNQFDKQDLFATLMENLVRELYKIFIISRKKSHFRS